MEDIMSDAQLATALFAAPFLTIALTALAVETIRISAIIRAEKQPRRKRPF